MKQFLVDLIICPSCLPLENKMELNVFDKEDDDIIKGKFKCSDCGAKYEIIDGIALLLPDFCLPDFDSQYENTLSISSYLWSHYGDVMQDKDATSAYKKWSEQIKCDSGISIDIGCAAGRMTFELGAGSNFAVGIDTSVGLIKQARALMQKKNITFPLPVEGLLNEYRVIHLPDSWKPEQVEFVVADALYLPFAANSFSNLTSLNIIDKVFSPVLHFKEINRIAKKNGASLLFSDPFSWSENITDSKNWLGGTTKGKFCGRGIENIVSIMQGEHSIFNPSLEIESKGFVWWKIRKHENLFELIKSFYLNAKR